MWSPLLFTHTDSTGDEEVAVDDDCSDVQEVPPPTRTTCSGRVICPVDIMVISIRTIMLTIDFVGPLSFKGGGV